MVIAGLLALVTTVSAAQSPAPISLIISVDPTVGAKGVFIDENGQPRSLMDPIVAQATIELPSPPFSFLGSAVSMEWSDGTSTIPTTFLPNYSGKSISIAFERVSFGVNEAEEADQLCWHTATNSLKIAFRKLFSCSEWVRLLESHNEYYSNTYLRGLRGWFEGNYYLFAKVKPVRELGFGPFGLQQELIERLTAVLTKNNGRTNNVYTTHLRLADVERAIREYEQQELKWFQLIRGSLSAGNVAEASFIVDHVARVFDRLSSDRNVAVIDGLNKETILAAAQEIRCITDPEDCAAEPAIRRRD